MAGPVYISTPAYWEQADKSFLPLMYKKNQRGGGSSYKKKAYMLPVQPQVQQVTPVAAETDRAVSELKETMRNEEPHMPLKKGIKRKAKRKSTSRKSTVRGSRRFSKKKKGARKKLKTLRKQLKKSSKVKRTKKQKKTKRKGTFPKGRPIL